MLLPATIGEDQPRPEREAVHSILEVFDHLMGRLELPAEGLDEGPRNPGHSGSPAKAQAITKRDAMTRCIILLNYKMPLRTAGRKSRISYRPDSERHVPVQLIEALVLF